MRDNPDLESVDWRELPRHSLLDSVRRLRQLVERRYAEKIPVISPTQYGVLRQLGLRGSLTQNKLGRVSSLDAATVHGVIMRLEQSGFVVREPHPHDMRCKEITLTSAGLGALKSAEEAAAQAEEELMESLVPWERTALHDLIIRLLEEQDTGAHLVR